MFWYDTLQYFLFQYNTIGYDMLWYVLFQYDTFWYDTFQYLLFRYDTFWYSFQYDLIRYDTIRANMIRYIMILFKRICSDAIQYFSFCSDTIRYGMIHFIVPGEQFVLDSNAAHKNAFNCNKKKNPLDTNKTKLAIQNPTTEELHVIITLTHSNLSQHKIDVFSASYTCHLTCT